MKRFCAAFAGLILAGCSAGNDMPSVELQVLDAARGAIASKTAPQTQRPKLTRAILDTLDVASIEVTLERNDQLAYLFEDAKRRDGRAGKITVWRTEDQVTLAMRNGVLIATRGLDGGIISSAVQVSGDAPGPSRGGERVQYIRALDNKEIRLSMACEVVNLGPEQIVIVERRHATRHVQERCAGGGGTVVNDYWIDSRAGVVWQSRQWAGPNLGYLRIRQLTN